MSCGLGVGPSQISKFAEPEAGLIPLNSVFVDVAGIPRKVELLVYIKSVL